MSVDALSGWVTELDAMPPSSTIAGGIANLATFFDDMSKDVNAVGGTVGIFAFDKATFESTLLGLGFSPTGTDDWIAKLGTAWEAGCSSAVITAGTVTDASWTASGSLDTETPSSGSGTILNLSAAKTIFETGLALASDPFIAGDITNETEANAAKEDFAAAWRDATLTFIFTCIGLILPPPPTPLSIPFAAE